MAKDFSSIVAKLGRRVGVSTGRMFGSPGLKANNKVFAMEVKGRLVVKLPSERVVELCSSGSAQQFDPGHGRKMKQWASIDANSDQDWLRLAEEALVYARK